MSGLHGWTLVEFARESPRTFAGAILAAGVLGIAVGTSVDAIVSPDPASPTPAMIEEYRVTPAEIAVGGVITIETVERRLRSDCAMALFREWAAADGVVVMVQHRGQTSTRRVEAIDGGRLRSIDDQVRVPDGITGSVRLRSLSEFDCPDGTFFVPSPWVQIRVAPPATRSMGREGNGRVH